MDARRGWVGVCVAAALATGCYDATGDDDDDIGSAGDDGGGAAHDGGALDAASCEETDARAGLHWDRDHDGFVSAACGGDDCDDEDPLTHPGAPDSASPWSVHEIGSSDAEPAIAVDGTSRTYVSTAGNVRSSADGLDWSVDRDLYIGHFAFTPIAIGPDDVAHIVFQTSAGELSREIQHASFAAGEWTYEIALSTERMNTSHERSSALAVDAEGRLHAAFRLPLEPIGQEVGVTYLTNRDGAWSVEEVDLATSGRESVGLAVDGDGAAHVAYPWSAENAPAEIRYATNASGAWVVETVLTAEWVSAQVAIALDGQGIPHLVFDGENGALQHADRSGGDWSVDELDVEGRGASMAADASGRLHVAYMKAAGVWYAEGDAGAWLTEEVQGRIAPDAYSRGVDLAVDADGAVHIVFLDQIDEGMYYATRAWSDGIDQNCDGADGVADAE